MPFHHFYTPRLRGRLVDPVLPEPDSSPLTLTVRM